MPRYCLLDIIRSLLGVVYFYNIYEKSGVGKDACRVVAGAERFYAPKMWIFSGPNLLTGRVSDRLFANSYINDVFLDLL